MQDDVKAGIAQLQLWLRDSAWPTWLSHGIDRGRGGFFEALTLDGKVCKAGFRRLRVVARQIYVFSEAHRAGLAGADAAVRLGLAFLERHAVHPEGGYAWRFDLNHLPIDTTRDLYDHAFVLLALSSATAVLPAASLRPAALDLLRWIDTMLPHPAGGYLEGLPASLPRRQNPHMHLLEALLAAHEAFADAVFLDRAENLIALFASRLFDTESGALPEFFDDDLNPDRRHGTFLVEPGHHCEWVWLLHRYQALTSPQPALQDISRRLMRFVDRHGIDPAFGGVIDLLNSDGTEVETGARLWPQTERLKAEFLRADPSPARQKAALAALAAYLRPDGLWHERRSAEGILLDQPAPASSLYHLTAAAVAVGQLAESPQEP